MTTVPLLTLQVRGEQDVVRARQRARQVAEGLRFDLQGQTKFITAISEIVRNAFRYAGGGQVAFSLVPGDAPAVEVVVSDGGGGIADLPAVLEGRYRSETGMGMGIVGARRLMDRFDITSTTEQGTRIRMLKFIPMRSRHLVRDLLPEVTETLARSLPQDPIGEIEQQNQELLRVLDELRQRQEELLQVNRELEDTNRGVVALHAELDTQALALRRASHLKTRFLSHMTHEFRTPLNSIQALANLLLAGTDGDLNHEQAKQVTYIRRSCEQLGELVNDLLDLAKVEAGKVAVRPEEFAIEELFGALKGALRPLMTLRGTVRLEFDSASNLPPMYSDQGKIAQILRNLISNAFKFTHQGEVRVFARELDGRVQIAVRDTGIGIAAEDQQRVFDEYTQVEKAQSTAIIGTGLGLPLSRRLAELLGGRLRVESVPGSGSTFVLDLPLRYSGSSEMPIVRESGRMTAIGQEVPRVLIIDDDDVSRYLLRSMLPKGLEVFEAATGMDGIACIHRHHPQVVFLDLMMPDVTGDVVLERLRADTRTAALPVIIHTAQDLDARLQERLASAVAILSKRTQSRDQANADILRALTHAGLTLPMGG